MTRVSRAASTAKESFDEAEVAAGDAGDGQRGFAVGWMFGVEGEPQFGPVQRQHVRHVVGVQWPVLVGESDPAYSCE